MGGGGDPALYPLFIADPLLHPFVVHTVGEPGAAGRHCNMCMHLCVPKLPWQPENTTTNIASPVDRCKDAAQAYRSHPGERLNPNPDIIIGYNHFNIYRAEPIP